MKDAFSEAFVWLKGLKFLSLDVSLGFYCDVGLVLYDKRAFQAMIRAAVRNARRHGESISEVIRFHETEVPVLLETLVRERGGDVAETLKLWVEDIGPGIDSSWDLYENCFAYARREFCTNAVDLLGLEDLASPIFGLYRRSLDTDDIGQRMDIVRRRGESEWDNDLLRDQSTDTFYPPLEQAIVFARLNRFQLFWEFLRPILARSNYFERLTELAAERFREQGQVLLPAAALRRRLPF